MDGIGSFAPTLMIESPRLTEFAVLEEIPPNCDADLFVKGWAAKVVGREQNYVLAFRFDEAHFKIVFRSKGVTHERLVAVAATF